MSTPIRIIYRPPELAGGVRVQDALQDMRTAIAVGNHRYICLAAEFMYSYALRCWLVGVMQYAGIKTDGAGFICENSPDWLLELNFDASEDGTVARRLHVLDLIIQELEKQ